MFEFLTKLFAVQEKDAPVITSSPWSTEFTKENVYLYHEYYDNLEIVNRIVNMIVDDAATFCFRSADTNRQTKKVLQLINCVPNPDVDSYAFKRNIVLDLLLEGNIFLYYDGVHIYQLPANLVVILKDNTQGPTGYQVTVDNQIYKPEEVIHIRDNGYSLIRGYSRLKSCISAMNLLLEMKSFQHTFFKNGAVPGLVLSTESTLSDKIKDRMTQNWRQKFNPKSGGRSPIILDGGMKLDPISNTTFKDLDFQDGVANIETTICKALGVPPILLDGGNNANISPNLRLYNIETILPIVKKIASSLNSFFDVEIEEDTTGILGLQPDLAEQASYYVSLTNGGIISANEARAGLGLEAHKDPQHDNIRVPQNVAGSAVQPTQGGRPKEPAKNA